MERRATANHQGSNPPPCKLLGSLQIITFDKHMNPLFILLLLCPLPAFTQNVDPAKFREAESDAPKGYSTLFVVYCASTVVEER
jgi:hypothetical protein